MKAGSEIEINGVGRRLNLGALRGCYRNHQSILALMQLIKAAQEFAGVLPFDDKASPEVIKREFGLSKNAFKRACGRLLKEGKIRITEKTIELVD